MKKTGLIIDSTVYIDESTIKENDVGVVSLNVLEGDNVYKETDITQQFVFDELDAGKKLTTSQPSPELFKEAFNEKINKGYEKVLVITISKGISGTFQSAQLGKDMCDDKSKIHIFDTLNAGFGNELLAMEALRLINETDDSDQVIKKMNTIIDSARLYFTVENLFSLQKGGRLSKKQALLGTVLRIRPIIKLHEDGTLSLVHKERTRTRLMNYLINNIKKDYENKSFIKVRIVNQLNDESVAQLKKRLEETFDNIDITVTNYIGPVFSIHIGKKGLGVTWYCE